MEKHYAQALWKMVEGGQGKDGMSPHKAVSALKELLEREGRSALMPRIARAFARIAAQESNTSTMVLTVAREKDERHAKAAAKGILAELGADAGDLETQVDDSLIGGWRLEGRSVLVDESYKSRLLALYNRVVTQ